MTTDLLWTPVTSSVKLLSSFSDFLDKVQSLDGSTPNSWVKWKDYENQTVVKTYNYFYKIYVTDKDSGVFQSIIREQLGNIYQDMGICWNVFTIFSLDKVYTIEQRQPLIVCTPTMDYQQLLLNWGETLTTLENSLQFNLLLKQIQEVYPEVKYIKLIRDCVSKYEDYALYNNKIVLLDDADFFICLLDENLNTVSLKFDALFVNVCGQTMLFAPLEYGNGSNKSNEYVDKWWLFPEDAGNGKSVLDFVSARTSMINMSAKVLAGMKELPSNEVDKLLPKSEQLLIGD